MFLKFLDRAGAAIVKKLSALQFHDKIFIAYGFVFLVMFGVVFGSTNFLTELAFKRQINRYVETLQAQISNSYRAFVGKVQKEVHTLAVDTRLRLAIEEEAPYALSLWEFDLLEYGPSDGKVLYTNAAVPRRARSSHSPDSQAGYIHLRNVPQQSDMELQFMVQVTEAGDWGFVTGGYRLQKWLETQTSIQSDEHPIFLVGKPHIPGTAAFPSPVLPGDPDSESEGMAVEEWLPLNYAAQVAHGNRWFKSLPSWLPERKVFLHGTEESGGRAFTAFRITPLNSPFATAREVPPVALIVAYSHERQMEWQRQLTLILLLSGVGGLALVYLIGYIISRRITRPIAVLREGVNHIAAGNLDHRVKIHSRNEVGQLAEGFNQMARDLKQSIEERMSAERAATWRDVARQVAHEIKNPLFPIRLSVENLQQAKSNPEIFEQIFDECTDTVIEEVDRIGKLIDEFHQFARMPKPQKKPTQLNNIVNSVLTLYTGFKDIRCPFTESEGVVSETSLTQQIPDLGEETGTAAANIECTNPVASFSNRTGLHESAYEDTTLQNSTEKFWNENVSKIKVETELMPLPLLSLDPEQIAQALGNLLKNAIEAMPDGGQLKVKTSYINAALNRNTGDQTPTGHALPVTSGDTPSTKEKNGRIENGSMDTDCTVLLEVQDTGHGMSEETMANLFVPYYTTKSEMGGTGLGMPIVRRIVAEHGAEIDFESAQGIGTTIRIYFPYNQVEAIS